ncbi:MAG: hypothetical protein H0V05_10715 [Euzebyaceae bacterium]|nr:hypothetical protein [Euzebyaceae bacterium]
MRVDEDLSGEREARPAVTVVKVVESGLVTGGAVRDRCCVAGVHVGPGHAEVAAEAAGAQGRRTLSAQRHDRRLNVTIASLPRWWRCDTGHTQL